MSAVVLSDLEKQLVKNFRASVVEVDDQLYVTLGNRAARWSCTKEDARWHVHDLTSVLEYLDTQSLMKYTDKVRRRLGEMPRGVDLRCCLFFMCNALALFSWRERVRWWFLKRYGISMYS